MMRLMLIITGTGRCGTGTMARLFGGHHEFRVEYLLEKYFRHLGPETKAFCDRDQRLAPVLDLLQGVDLAGFVDASNLYIHFLDVLPLVDPGVRVILLVRNAEDFARSAIRRGWHTRREYGLVPQVGDDWHSRWPELSPGERAAWIWQYRNRLALEGLAGYPPERSVIVPVETLAQAGVAEKLAAFAGRPLADPAAAGKKFNAGIGAPGGPEDPGPRNGRGEGNPFFSARAWELAGPLMEAFGYGKNPEAIRPGSGAPGHILLTRQVSQ